MKGRIFAAFAVLATGAADTAPGWRRLDPANTLVIDTSAGRIVVEMHPELAPASVARVKLLAREGVYDGLLFHRVIDHFVNQTGNPNNHDGGVSKHPDLPPEFTARVPALNAVAARTSDQISGFIGSVPVVGVQKHGQPGAPLVWGAYCPGVAGMGRQAAPDTGNSEIFFMRDASRVLDHDYTVWGRAVSGLEVIRRIAVGEPPAHPDRMISVRVMADLPVAEQPHLEVEDTRGPAFQLRLAAEVARKGAAFSLCDVDVPARVLAP
jgi:peptidylprolyl isomerase